MRGLADHGDDGVSGGDSSRAGNGMSRSIRSEIVVIINTFYDLLQTCWMMQS